MELGKIFLACDRADAKCEVYEWLWGMVGVLGLRGSLMLRWWLAENSDVWQLARSPLLARQAHSHRDLNNNNLTTLPATVFSDLTALQFL